MKISQCSAFIASQNALEFIPLRGELKKLYTILLKKRQNKELTKFYADDVEDSCPRVMLQIFSIYGRMSNNQISSQNFVGRFKWF